MPGPGVGRRDEQIGTVRCPVAGLGGGTADETNLSILPSYEDGPPRPCADVAMQARLDLGNRIDPWERDDKGDARARQGRDGDETEDTYRNTLAQCEHLDGGRDSVSFALTIQPFDDRDNGAREVFPGALAPRVWADDTVP